MFKTDEKTKSPLDEKPEGQSRTNIENQRTDVAGNATQTVASAYSDNAILKNVIENGDETKLNKQFFENALSMAPTLWKSSCLIYFITQSKTKA